MAVAPSCFLSRIEASSCKSYVGLRPQCPNTFGIKPSINGEFRDKVFKSIHSRTINGKPTRGCATMMPVGTPKVLYRNQIDRTWQWIDIWNALYRDSIVFIGQHIDEKFSNTLLCTLLYLDTIDELKTLHLFINCPGGDLTPSLSIYDTIRSMKKTVGTLCIGHAANMAGFILAAGEKGKRTGMPIIKVELQAPAGTARGQADDIKIEVDELLRIKDYLFAELAQHTEHSVEQVHKDLNRRKRFNAKQAIEYGIIDRIVTPEE